jgi:hypothetical protein
LAVVDTARSLNGQLVATIGMTLKRKVLCGYPVYKGDPLELIPGNVHALRSWGIDTVALQANRQFVMRAAMKRELEKRGGEWFLFPTGLRLPESVHAIEEEGNKVRDELSPKTVIVPSGTGTHLAGLIRAWEGTSTEFIATLGYKREEMRFRRDVKRAVGYDFDQRKLRVVMTDSEYYDVHPDQIPPWPAHLHYECRAWSWLKKHSDLETLPQPICFWNIGA